MAVEPNHDDDILGTIRSNAVEAASNATPNTNNNPTSTTRRTITMYRSGFTIDNGPFRRLDDPNNADFLHDLARGVTPRELFIMDDDDEHDGAIGDMEVGLLDKRHLEYEDDDHSQTNHSANNAAVTTTTAFTGVGQSLGSSNHNNTSSSSNGIITPSTFLTSTSTIPSLDESTPITSIQIRLHNGKKIIVKCNLHDTIHTFVSRIINQQQQDSGTNEQPFVLSSGYPPRVLNDMNKTVEECGLKNAQVIQKLV